MGNSHSYYGSRNNCRKTVRNKSCRDLYLQLAFFIGLWIAATILSLAYICKRHLKRRKATCALHLAFILILSGALTTHLWGIQGSVHLRQGANPVTTFTTNDGQTADFPFGVSLKQFELAYYQGTFAPMDFVSILNIHDGDTTLTGKASMNHIYTYRHYRFYQSAYDADQQGSTFSVTCDPYGIALTYTGYVALLLAFIGFFFDRHSYFRKLLHHPSLKRTVACLLLLIGSVAALEASVPPTLPKKQPASLGNSTYITTTVSVPCKHSPRNLRPNSMVAQLIKTLLPNKF